MWNTEIEKLITDLTIAADSISSQSLSDIQILLRKAAEVIAEFDLPAVDTNPNGVYNFTWKDVN